jgi:hypothetical protein
LNRKMSENPRLLALVLSCSKDNEPLSILAQSQAIAVRVIFLACAKTMVALAKTVCRRALRKIYEQEFLSSLPSPDLRTKIGEHHVALNSEH